MDKNVLYRPKISRAIELLEQKMIHIRDFIVSVKLKSLIELCIGGLHHVLNICTKKTFHITSNNLFLHNKLH